MAEGYRVTVAISEQGDEHLQALAVLLGTKSKTRIIDRALALARWLAENAEGGEIVVVKDGVERRVVLL